MKILVLISVALATCEAAIKIEDGRPVVNLSQGRALGVSETKWNVKHFAFRGIPFAKSPVGDLRFQDPQPAEPWEGTLDVKESNIRCPQMNNEAMLTQSFEAVGQEDCLILNLYTPEAAKDPWAKLPVMVFIHGGSFTMGSAQEYDNTTFVTKGVIFIAINYRLGVLGFLSSGDEKAPGNYGLKDQVMALRWINENIAEFGGDPDKVTIFGESAGGASVHFLTLAPSARGLFSRAIIQSGTAFSNWATGRNFKNNLISLAKILECPNYEDRNDALKCIKNADSDKLVTAFSDLSMQDGSFPQRTFGPRTDGDFIPADPAILTRLGAYAKVPTMIGTTKDEGVMTILFSLMLPNITTAFENEFENIGPIFLGFEDEKTPVETAKKVFEHYAGTTKFLTNQLSKYSEICTDVSFAIGTDIFAKSVSNRAPVYLYSIDYRGENSFCDLFLPHIKDEVEVDVSKDVCHSDELQYMFDITWFGLKGIKKEQDFKMRKIILDLWTNFAITGNPTPDGRLGTTWAPVNEENLWHLSIDFPLKMESDSRADARKFWASLDLKRNSLLGLQETEKPIGKLKRYPCDEL